MRYTTYEIRAIFTPATSGIKRTHLRKGVAKTYSKSTYFPQFLVSLCSFFAISCNFCQFPPILFRQLAQMVRKLAHLREKLTHLRKNLRFWHKNHRFIPDFPPRAAFPI
jgi:hypothetical protein